MNRYVCAAAVLLATAAGAVALVRSAGTEADLQAQITTRMRITLERSDPGRHQHAAQQVTTEDEARPAVICGVRVYGYEPAGVTTLAEVRAVYGFHLCGVAERDRPWDVAVKLAGPVILDLSTEPAGIRVVEATDDVRFVDRLRQMFPARYAQLALTEALTDSETADLRRRYDATAGL
jgi:hypothetical protein